MLKLKLQYFGHLMRRVDLLEKTLMLGGIGSHWKGFLVKEGGGLRALGRGRWETWGSHHFMANRWGNSG